MMSIGGDGINADVFINQLNSLKCNTSTREVYKLRTEMSSLTVRLFTALPSEKEMTI